MKDSNVFPAEILLREMEQDCVTACGRFITGIQAGVFTGFFAKDGIWLLGRKGEKPAALIMSSRSTLMPVFRGSRDIGGLWFLKKLFKDKNVHSIQGILNEVLMLEEEFRLSGKEIADIFDYDLMTLDSPPLSTNAFTPGVLLLTPQISDLDEIAPLQASYEREEVIPKGSSFHSEASRLNLANIIANGKILAALANGRIIGKINVNSVSFTRCQVGGVYVHPDYRGRGIARYMAREFISSIIKEGWGVTLYVKKNNAPAQRLYRSLGFTPRCDYRITYY